MTEVIFILINEDEQGDRHFYMSKEFDSSRVLKNKIFSSYNYNNIKDFIDWNNWIEDFFEQYTTVYQRYLKGFTCLYYEITEENKNEFFSDEEDIYDITSWDYYPQYICILNLTSQKIAFASNFLEPEITYINPHVSVAFDYSEYLTDCTPDYNDPEEPDNFDFNEIKELIKKYEKFNLIEDEAIEWYNSDCYDGEILPHEIINIYEEPEDLAANIANDLRKLPEWACPYFDYHKFGKELLINSTEYYELSDGRVIEYK